MLTTAATTRCRGDSGSALMLMPAAVLIMIVLGAIAFDLSHLHLGERQLRTATMDAADAAAGAGVDQTALRTTGAVRLDRVAAEEMARLSMATAWPSTVQPGTVTVTVDDATGTVTVAASGTVRPVFARALPGAGDGTTVTATSTASLVER